MEPGCRPGLAATPEAGVGGIDVLLMTAVGLKRNQTS